MPSKARPEIFLKNIKKKGPKIHCLALKLYTGPPNCITRASKSGGRGGPGPRGGRAPGVPPLDPLVESAVKDLPGFSTVSESE